MLNNTQTSEWIKSIKQYTTQNQNDLASKQKKANTSKVLGKLANSFTHVYQQNDDHFTDVKLNDRTSYEKVEPAQIIDLWEHFHGENMLITVFNMSSNALVGTGTIFQEGEVFLDDRRGKELGRVYSIFARDLLKSCFVYGFAVVALLQSDTLGAIPVCCHLPRLDVYVQIDWHQNNHYQFYVKRPINSAASQQALPGLMVFELDKPDGAKLRSRIMALKSDYEVYKQAQACWLTSVQIACNPPRVLEPIPEVVNEEKAHLNLTPAKELGEIDATHRLLTGRALTQERIEHAEKQILAADNVNAGRPVNFGIGASEYVNRKTGTVTIKSNHTLVSQVVPQPIDISPIQSRIAELTTILFGVPRSLYASQSSGRSVSANEENMMNTFREGQRGLKRFVLNALNTVFNAIYKTKRLQQIVEGLTDEELADPNITVEELLHRATMTINLPNIPNMEEMKEWYTMGVLKYDALVHSAASVDFTPLQYFHKEPQMSLDDLNGVKPPPAPPQAMEKTTTTKSATKTSGGTNSGGGSKGNSTGSTVTTITEKPVDKPKDEGDKAAKKHSATKQAGKIRMLSTSHGHRKKMKTSK